MNGIETIGKEWRHPRTGEVRYYVNNAWRYGGLEVEHHNTGSISAAWVDNERISNCEARRLIDACEKVWVTEEGKVHFKGEVSREYSIEFREKVKTAIEDAVECAIADAQAEESIARGEEALDAYLASLE